MLAPSLVFLAIAYLIGRLVYWVVIDREVPGGWDRRFGKLEELPLDVGQWKVDDQSESGKTAAARGLKREVRLFHDVQTGNLTSQTRHRNAATNVVTSVEPDVRVPRRRVRI